MTEHDTDGGPATNESPPAVSRELLDRWEQLLNRADQAHFNATEQIRLHLRYAEAIARFTRQLPRQQIRVEALNAAAIVASSVAAQHDFEDDAAVARFWLDLAREAERYILESPTTDEEIQP